MLGIVEFPLQLNKLCLRNRKDQGKWPIIQSHLRKYQKFHPRLLLKRRDISTNKFLQCMARFGLCTYPNGYQRACTMEKLKTRRVAYYTNSDGLQTLHSISSLHTDYAPLVQAQFSSNNTTTVDLQGRTCISSQALQNLSYNKRREIT